MDDTEEEKEAMGMQPHDNMWGDLLKSAEAEESKRLVDDIDSRDGDAVAVVESLQNAFIRNQLLTMGFERNAVNALIMEAKEPLQNVDQAFDVMYDPSRHNFFTTSEL